MASMRSSRVARRSAPTTWPPTTHRSSFTSGPMPSSAPRRAYSEVRTIVATSTPVYRKVRASWFTLVFATVTKCSMRNATRVARSRPAATMCSRWTRMLPKIERPVVKSTDCNEILPSFERSIRPTKDGTTSKQLSFV